MHMAHLSTYFSLEDPTGAHDVKRIKRELDGLPGVTSVSVSPGAQADWVAEDGISVSPGGCLAVDYDSTGVRQSEIRQKVQELGYQLRATD